MMDVVTRSQVWVVLDQQDRERNEKKRHSREEPLDGGEPIRVGQHDHDHYKVAHSLDPSLHRHAGVVGPEYTYTAVEEKHDNRQVCAQERDDFLSSGDKYNQAEHQEPGVHDAVNRVPFQILLWRFEITPLHDAKFR